MGMVGNLLRVSKAELENYLEDSSLLEERIYDDESDDEDESLVGIDKSWDGIIFLLTGQIIGASDHPLEKILFSGQLIDKEQDLGYGPAHYLTPEQVVDLNNQISKITLAELKQKFDPKKMTESGVYPSIWDEDDGAFEYLAEGFSAVQEIFAKASKNGESIITFIN